MERRPLKTRAARWPHEIAAALTGVGVTPNQVSVLSVFFAVLGALLLPSGNAAGLVLAAIAMQLRLLCNLLDGLMAVEGGKKTATGDLYNDVPDRVADVVLLVGAGAAVPDAMWLGWTAAVLAVAVAYVRTLGASLLGTHDFRGPMAKPHRMFALTLGAFAAAIETATVGTTWTLGVALVIIVAGSVVTIVRRLLGTARALQEAG